MSHDAQKQMHSRFNLVEGSLERLLHRLPGMAYRCAVIGPEYEYRLDFVTRGCESLFGISMKDVLKKPANVIERLMPEEDLLMVRQVMHESLVAHRPYEIYYRITPPGKSMIWVWDQGEGVYDAEGRCLYIEGIIMDVTEQKTTEQNLFKENQRLRTSIKNSYGLGAIVGKSEIMQNVYSLMIKAANSDANVILYGETGSGKDMAAQTIHELSGVSGRYVPVNCSAIPSQLLESEFFGHVKGAFSGAISNKAGYLAAANEGTLFLDEIGELPLELQGKLLRVLETKTYTPVGSNEIKRSNFRLISATNQNIQEMVRQKAMRADFYYRIHVLAIQMPPLRARQGDIPLLIDAYAQKHAITRPIPASVRLLLEQHPWPGNIRELQNALDRFWAFGETGLELSPDETGSIPSPSPAIREIPPTPDHYDSAGTLNKAKDELEKQRILSMLRQCHWKKGATASALGVTMRTLQRKIKRHGITR